MIINLPIPYIVIQSDVIIKNKEMIDKMDFLLVSLFYCCSKKAINKDNLLFDEIKNKLNLENKFFPFIKNILKKMKMSGIIEFDNEINDDTFIGEIKLNKYIIEQIDDEKFYTFSDTEINKIVFINKPLVWSNKKEELTNNNNLNDIDISLLNNKNINLNKDQFINIVENKYPLDNEKQIFYKINLSPDIYYKQKNIEYNVDVVDEKIKIDDDLRKTIDSIIENHPNYYDFFIKKMENELSIDNEFEKIEHNINFESFNKLDNKTIEIINQNNELKKLFIDQKCDLYINDNKSFKLYRTLKQLSLTLKDSIKKINVYFLLLSPIDLKEEIKETFDFNLPNLFEQSKKIGDYFLNIIHDEIIKRINNGDEIKPNFLKFLWEYKKINFDIFKKINIYQSYFDGNSLHPFIFDLFKYKKNLVDINEFHKFDINDSIQKELNEIYNFDFSKRDKSIFKNSIDETNFENLKNLIYKFNYEKSTVEEKEELKIKINQYKFKWLNASFLTFPILEKINDDILVNIKKIKNDNLSISNEIRKKIELYWMNNKNNNIEILKIKQFTNKFHHYNNEIELGDYKMQKKYNEQLNKYLKYINENLK